MWSDGKVVTNNIASHTIQFSVSFFKNYSISFYLLLCFSLHFRSYTLYIIPSIFLTCSNECIKVSPCPWWEALKLAEKNKNKSYQIFCTTIGDLSSLTSSNKSSFSCCSLAVNGSPKSIKKNISVWLTTQPNKYHMEKKATPSESSSSPTVSFDWFFWCTCWKQRWKNK